MEPNKIGIYDPVKVVRNELKRVKQDAAAEKEKLLMLKTIDLEFEVSFGNAHGGGDVGFTCPSTRWRSFGKRAGNRADERETLMAVVCLGSAVNLAWRLKDESAPYIFR